MKQALRSLHRSPALTATVVLTLGLGIGLNTAVFSVVHGVLLRPLGYAEPDRLVYVQADLMADGVENADHSGGDYRDIRESVSSFEAVAAVTRIQQNLTGPEVPRRIAVGWASQNLFQVLGVDAALGRVFAADDPPGTALLGHSLWTTSFGADPDVLGSSVQLDGHPYTVVGVLPEGFELPLPRFGQDIQAWKVPDDWWQNGDAWGAQGPQFALFQIVGRLAPGATLAQLTTELDAVTASLRRRFAGHDRSGLTLSGTPLLDTVVSDVRPTLLMLLGAVGLVLLIACANVMNLLLARANTRFREIAVRRALGSGRGRLLRLLLAESLALAGLGGALGVMLAVGGVEALRVLAPDGLPRTDGVSLAPGVLLFALLVSVLCTFLFGLVPALQASKALNPKHAHGSRTSASRGQLRTGSALVIGQIALSLVLLTDAGLLASSFVRLHGVRPGFDYENVLTLRANPWGAGLVEFQVVGVAQDVRYQDLREPAEPAVYFDSQDGSGPTGR